MKKYNSIGDGKFKKKEFNYFGNNVIIEYGVKFFNCKNISIQNNVYIGHGCFINAYLNGFISIDHNTWIGQNCFIHGAGKIMISDNVGIGPHVKMFTSYHDYKNRNINIMDNKIIKNEIIIKSGSDIGIGSVLLPGVKIGKGSMIGAGSIVTKNVKDFEIVAGSPAKNIGFRT